MYFAYQILVLIDKFDYCRYFFIKLTKLVYEFSLLGAIQQCP